MKLRYLLLIIMDLIIIIFIVTLNSILKALSDTIKNNFSNSIFRNLDRWWWDPSISWKKSYIDDNPRNGKKAWYVNIFRVYMKFPYPNPFKDMWNISNTLQISLWLILPFICSKLFVNQLLLYILLIILYIFVFNLFYNTIFKKK